MSFRLVESSSDVIAEAEGPTLADALLGLARAFTHVTTAGAAVAEREHLMVEVDAQGDPSRLAVAFVNELVFHFATQAFLPAGGELTVERHGTGWRAEGTLRGERFDPTRHPVGTEVKAAALHDALLEMRGGHARARVLLDL